MLTTVTERDNFPVSTGKAIDFKTEQADKTNSTTISTSLRDEQTSTPDSHKGLNQNNYNASNEFPKLIKVPNTFLNYVNGSKDGTIKNQFIIQTPSLISNTTRHDGR